MNKTPSLLIGLFTVLLTNACSSGDSEISLLPTSVSGVDNNLPDSVDNTNSQGIDPLAAINTNSLADNGCQNVIVMNGFGYAACGDGIEVINLQSLERSFISQPADDITGDTDLEQSGNTLQQFDLADPMQPNVITTVNTNFLIFSGVSAANGILAVSGGSGGSDTEVFTYDATSLSVVLTARCCSAYPGAIYRELWCAVGTGQFSTGKRVSG